MVWTRGKDGGKKITKYSFTWTCRGKEKQRETEEDLDGQCQGRPEREEHRLDQDWRSDQKQRGLDESCKSLIVSTLMEERKEEEVFYMGLALICNTIVIMRSRTSKVSLSLSPR